jgi:serine/threonine-protein phosphatase CPPED1
MLLKMNRKTFVIIVALLLLVLITTIAAISSFYYPKVSDWNNQELQKINKSSGNFSFLIFGDNRDSVETFNELIDNVNKENVTFAVDNGDLVSRGDMTNFGFFLKQIERSNKPFITNIGNHELNDNSEANYQKIFGPSYYSFADNNSYFIMLDDANGKNVDTQQMSWLEQELQKGQGYKYRFIVMHVPLYDPRGNGSEEGHSLEDLSNAQELQNLFDQYNVTMIFASHIHGYYEGVWGKTPFIISGGAGAELEYPDPQHNFFHYIKVDVSDQGVSYNLVKL